MDVEKNLSTSKQHHSACTKAIGTICKASSERDKRHALCSLHIVRFACEIQAWSLPSATVQDRTPLGHS